MYNTSFHSSRSCRLMVLLAACGLVGCRSTRNTMSTWPGMGWLASHDEQIVEEWEEASPSATASDLQSPSHSATPQIASHGSVKNAGDRAAREAKSLAAKSKDVASDYPDTGYPNPYQDSASEPRTASADRYATGRYGSDRVSSSTRSSTETNKSSKGTGPQRGFYAADESDESASSKPSSSRWQRDGQASAEQDSNGRDVAESGNRLSKSLDAASRKATQGAASARAAVAATTEDAAAEYERAGHAIDRATREIAEDTSETSSDANPVSDTAASLSSAAHEVASGAKQAYRDAADELKGQATAGAEAVAGKANQAVEGLQDTANEAAQSLNEQADATRRNIRSRWNSLTTDAESSETAASEPGEAASGGSGAKSRYSSTDEQEDLVKDEPKSRQHSSSNAASNAPPTRNAKPWRPGGTSTYSHESLDQAKKSRWSHGDSEVEPASYRSSHSPRLSPTME